MAIVKLTAGGPRVLFFVERIDDSKNNRNNPEWKFIGRTEADSNAAAFVSVETAERQCRLIGVDRATILNRWIEFSKTAAGYIDIKLPANSGAVSNGAASPAHNGTASAAAPAPIDKAAEKKEKREKWESIAELYAFCEDYVLRESVPKMNAKGITVSHEGMAKQVATLFSGISQKGLV